MYTDQNNACCAVEDIYDLQSTASAEDAMKLFVKEHIVKTDSYYDYYNSRRVGGGVEVSIPGHVVFTEVVGVYRGNKKVVPGRYDVKVNGYGKRFSTYIKRHKLGSVIASVATRNHVNHPNHAVKVYVWSPNIKAIKALNKKKGWVRV